MVFSPIFSLLIILKLSFVKGIKMTYWSKGIGEAYRFVKLWNQLIINLHKKASN